MMEYNILNISKNRYLLLTSQLCKYRYELNLSLDKQDHSNTSLFHFGKNAIQKIIMQRVNLLT